VGVVAGEFHRRDASCFAAPPLYSLGQKSWHYPPFHDDRLGGNRYYGATAGWDFATGWGSPDLYNLATPAVAYRKQSPLPSGSNACASALSSAVSAG
jgi:hypothetical protein